jgi:hypothetical protein
MLQTHASVQYPCPSTVKKISLAIGCWVCVSLAQAQPASWGSSVGPRPESEALAQSVPIADVHMHFGIRRQAVAQMMQRMNESNVRWERIICRP